MRSSAAVCVIGLVFGVLSCSDRRREAGGEVAASDSTVSVTSVDLLRVGTVDQMLGKRAADFAARDTILAVVHTAGRARDAALTMRWTAPDGGLVNETTQLVNLGGVDDAEFRLAPVGGWPKGNLRAQVLVNGALQSTTTFRVR